MLFLCTIDIFEDFYDPPFPITKAAARRCTLNFSSFAFSFAAFSSAFFLSAAAFFSAFSFSEASFD